MIASVDEPIPTVLGLLCIGTLPRTWIPGSYIQFLRIRGTKLSDPVADELEISGTISEILRRLDEKLTAHLTTGVDFTSQNKEVRSSPYPLVALQQLGRNAVMHRTYEGTNAPVRFTGLMTALRSEPWRPLWNHYRKKLRSTGLCRLSQSSTGLRLQGPRLRPALWGGYIHCP